MLDFLKFGRKDPSERGPSRSRSFIRGTPDGNVTVVNLERTGWAIDPDGSGRGPLEIRPASGGEVCGAPELGGCVRASVDNPSCPTTNTVQNMQFDH